MRPWLCGAGREQGLPWPGARGIYWRTIRDDAEVRTAGGKVQCVNRRQGAVCGLVLEELEELHGSNGVVEVRDAPHRGEKVMRRHPWGSAVESETRPR